MKPINREIRTAYANGPKVTVASVKDAPTLPQANVSNEADDSYIENAAKLQTNTMTDEEIDEEINRLKANPEAFEKRVALLRTAFKSEEEAQAKLYQDQEAAKQAENENSGAYFRKDRVRACSPRSQPRKR